MEKPLLTLWRYLTDVAWAMGNTPGVDYLWHDLKKKRLSGMKESIGSSLDIKEVMQIHSLSCL